MPGATPFDDLIERTHDPLGGLGEVNAHGQRFAIEVIDDVEHSKTTPIGQLVVHEVH